MKLAEIRELMETFDGMNIAVWNWRTVRSPWYCPRSTPPHSPRIGKSLPAAREPELRPMPPVEAEAAAELTPAVPETPASAVTEGEAVTAPVVGVFYSASAPGAAPFVKVGDRVQKGQTLCIVEAMKMMNEITADFDGIVTEIAPKDGDLVEYGAPLCYLKRVCMFRRILIANRGEIAVRIIRACKEMGIETVAVYSTADSSSLHVHLADMAVCIGPAASAQSYLNVQNILSAATRLGCDAIHPGYGFLSENSEFARLVEQCGMVFIGPDADVIDKMGDKAAAGN